MTKRHKICSSADGQPVRNSTTVGKVIGKTGPSHLIRLGHLKPAAESLPVLLRQLLGQCERILDEAEEERKVESLRIGHIVDIDGHRLSNDRTQ